jgi:hypothetical protein
LIASFDLGLEPAAESCKKKMVSKRRPKINAREQWIEAKASRE